jgi:hypothetical protein
VGAVGCGASLVVAGVADDVVGGVEEGAGGGLCVGGLDQVVVQV